MAPRPEPSFVFPVFDEEENVGPLLARAVALGCRLGRITSLSARPSAP